MSATFHVNPQKYPQPETRNTLDEAVHFVDALLDRFVRTTGRARSLHPLEAIRLMHDGAVLGGGSAPLPADLALLDKVIAEAFPDTRALIDIWYRDTSSVQEKADRLGISRTDIYKVWKQHLGYIAGALRTYGAQLGP